MKRNGELPRTRENGCASELWQEQGWLYQRLLVARPKEIDAILASAWDRAEGPRHW